MTQAIAENAPGPVESALIQGDLAGLSEPQRIDYYRRVCATVGLNPMTKPFEYLWLKGEGGKEKLVLYATRACTDQLRALHRVSLAIVDRKESQGVYVVTARATTPDGRADESTGAVPLEREEGNWKTAQSGKKYFEGTGKFLPFRGETLANALMKAETKAKRRVTLSICGLGYLDESEVESIDSARVEVSPPPAPAPKQIAHQPASNGKPSQTQTADILKTADQWLVEKRLAATGELVAALENRFGSHLGELAPETVKVAIDEFKAPRIAKARQAKYDEIDQLVADKAASWTGVLKATGLEGKALTDLTIGQADAVLTFLEALPTPEAPDEDNA